MFDMSNSDALPSTLSNSIAFTLMGVSSFNLGKPDWATTVLNSKSKVVGGKKNLLGPVMVVLVKVTGLNNKALWL